MNASVAAHYDDPVCAIGYLKPDLLLDVSTSAAFHNLMIDTIRP
jgi:hypothetical protein